MFEVRVGKGPWAHGLTTRTFTIGTVPKVWRDCALVVEARRGTSLMLFEFD